MGLATEAELPQALRKRASSSVIRACSAANSSTEEGGLGVSSYSQARLVRTQRPHAGKHLSHLRLFFLQLLQA